MDDKFDAKALTSEYNEAGYQIARLNNLWSLCNTHARNGQLEKYKWDLDRIWIELSSDAQQKNKDYYFKGIKMLNNMISKSRIPQLLYKFLQEKEIFLKQLQEDVGKGSKKKEGYEDIM